MLEYIKNNKNGTIIYKSKTKYEEKTTCLTVIKNLCLEHLFSYEGYKKSVHIKFNKRNLLPVVLNSELVLMPIKRTKEYDNIWINLKAIKKVISKDKNLIITFFSNKEIEINISHSFYLKQVKLASLIEIEKSKHFH